jgi:hypothetical protein
MVHAKFRVVPGVDAALSEPTFAEPACVPSGESDFLAEVHGARRGYSLSQLFGETMSKKNSNKADAQQTKGS